MSSEHRDGPEVARIPIIRLWGQLIVPLQGDLTDRQAKLLCGDVLERIQSTGARGLVVDLSGLWMVDSHLCAVLARLARTARLMGTDTVITGMSPEVATTLLAMGIEFRGVRTALGLEQGLALLDVRVEGQGREVDEATRTLEQELLDGDPTDLEVETADAGAENAS